jgi:hypothetical protein
VTPRVAAVSQLVPALLGIYFDVLISYTDEQHLKEFLPVVFQRMGQIYAYPPYQDAVRSLMVTKVLSILHTHPSFLVSMKVFMSNNLLY